MLDMNGKDVIMKTIITCCVLHREREPVPGSRIECNGLSSKRKGIWHSVCFDKEQFILSRPGGEECSHQG